VPTIDGILEKLGQVIGERRTSSPDASYTARLLAGGVAAIGAKVMEEAGEVVEAASEPADQRQAHVVHEAADLLYHLWVLLAACDVAPGQVAAELERRFGMSGLAEKASRTPSTGGPHDE